MDQCHKYSEIIGTTNGLKKNPSLVLDQLESFELSQDLDECILEDGVRRCHSLRCDVEIFTRSDCKTEPPHEIGQVSRKQKTKPIQL